MGYRYCVFGAGRQGVAAIYDLIKNCEAEEVFVNDPNLTSVLDAQVRLKELLSENDYRLISWSSYVNQEGTDDKEDLGRFDVMLSCAPWCVNLYLSKLAASFCVPFCDLGGNPDTVSMQEKLETESAIVPDCGLSPGISNILAACLARRGYEKIEVRCGGIPAANPDSYEGLNYFLTFDPMGLISEYSGDATIIIGGQIETRKALSGHEGYGDYYECAYTSNNSRQVVENLRNLGVHNYDYKTLRYIGHFDLVRGWKEAGFLQGNTVADKRLADTLSGNPKLSYTRGYDHDKVLLFVGGWKSAGSDDEDKPMWNGVRESFGWEFEVWADSSTNFSAMEQMTAWGITMVAYYMAKNKEAVPNGFATPDRFVDADWILEGLKKRGV